MNLTIVIISNVNVCFELLFTHFPKKNPKKHDLLAESKKKVENCKKKSESVAEKLR